MINIDNMGGITAADFILQRECKSIIQISNKCDVVLSSGDWKALNMQNQSFNLKIESKNEDAGMYFHITGIVNLLPTSEYIDLLELNIPLIIRYKRVDGSWKVIGTNEYPLICTLAYLDPATAASFKGYTLSFEGKQLIAPPLLRI